MSVNRHRPHLIVLPEDDANRQIANGFEGHLGLSMRSIQILPEAGGWKKVVDEFISNQIRQMRKYPERRIVLVIDFDEQGDRLEYVKQEIPNDLEDRVFIIGVFSEPEKLKQDVDKSFEEIGKLLANDCSDNVSGLWSHLLLKHNESELERMAATVKPILFV